MRSQRQVALRLYQRFEVVIAGSETFVESATRYLWPQARQVPVRDSQPVVRLLVGTMSPRFTDRAVARPVMLYSLPDGHVPDYNEGIEYRGIPGLDRVIVNPHTGSRVLVTGDRVCIVNPDYESGARDALRVVKQLVTTNFEAAGIRTVHASAFALGRRAVAVVGRTGAGKTTTVLAAATRARLMANDKLYAYTDSSGTQVQGWTDPIRMIEAAGHPKRTTTLADYFTADTSRVAAGPLPLESVVIAQVGTPSVPIRCEELDRTTGLALLQREVLPFRDRWLGMEPLPTSSPLPRPSADRFLRLTYGYHDAPRATELLLKHLDR